MCMRIYLWQSTVVCMSSTWLKGASVGQVLPLDVLYKMAKPGGALNKDTLEVCLPITPLAYVCTTLLSNFS